FEIEMKSTGAFEWAFFGKLKTAPDSAYVPLIHGATEVLATDRSHGDFFVDIDAAGKLEPQMSDLGALTVHFDSTVEPRTIGIFFESPADANGVKSPK